VEEVGLSKAVFWKNTTGASAPVFFCGFGGLAEPARSAGT
jgi:hypothetical protein